MPSKSAARKLANHILQENRNGRSYREISREDYPAIKPGTLNRIAKSKGKWLPKKKEILEALGLYRPHSYPRPSWLYKWYRLPKDERYQVIKSHVDG